MSSNRKLQIHELIAQGRDVWVRNITNPLGPVSISLKEGNPCPIPTSRDPINLSALLTEEELKESPSLRRALMPGRTGHALLELVEPEVAEEYYRVHHKDPNHVLTMRNDIISRKILDTPEPDQAEISVEPVKVSPRVVQLCLELRHPSLTDQDIKDQLEVLWDTLEDHDQAYIIANVKPSIMDWLSMKRVTHSGNLGALSGPLNAEDLPGSSLEGISESGVDDEAKPKVLAQKQRVLKQRRKES
jgi:hypothetical protein